MATFRSNLNSDWSTSTLSSLKKRIATCFLQHCRRSTAKKPQIQKQHQRFQCSYEEEEYSFVRKASENFKNINKKFKKLFTSTKKKTRYKSEQVQENSIIVAKLLSSTLIAATTLTTTTTTTSTNLVHCDQRESSSMTISEQTFIQVREEYPDLDLEVRSILIARAQDGATISNIREDYRKNTGMKFPIYCNVTEFLLSIPMVTAFCNENGTRIFNIKPSDKTQHMFDLVTQQKQSYTTRPFYMNVRRRIHKGDDNNNHYEINNNNNNNNNHCEISNNDNNNNNNNNNSNNNLFNNNNQSSTLNIQNLAAIEHQQGLQSQPFTGALKIALLSNTDEFMDKNRYYVDNCNHLFNRLHNQNGLETNNNYNNKYQLNEDLLKKFNIQRSDNNILGNHKNFNPNQNQQYKSQRNLINNKRRYYETFRPPFKRNFRMRPSSPTATRSSYTNESRYTSDSEYYAHLLDFPLVGDDFFLFLARMELNCKFEKKAKVLRSGLCVSGQTIAAATKRIQDMDDTNKRMIVNIGSVDIMMGKPLVKIEHDFHELLTAMHRKGIKPILTTLAPLANYAHDKIMREKMDRFNVFIKRFAATLTVVDIEACLVNERNQILFDCYQELPRSVTGATESYVFWNKIGRQRILQKIESGIEY